MGNTAATISTPLEMGASKRNRRKGLAVLLGMSMAAAACGGSGGDDGAEKFEEVDEAIAAPTDDSADEYEESEAPGNSQQEPALKAGSVDDNADFPAYLAYRDQFLQSGLPVRSLDIDERHTVQIVDANNRPVANALVTVLADGEPQAEVRAGNDGIVYIHPGAYGRIEPQDILEVQVGQSDTLKLDRSDPGVDTLQLNDSQQRFDSADLDIIFLLDATGSMADEIEQLRTTIDNVAQRLDDLPSRPNVRLGLTHYRDQGDAYVSETFDLTGDIDDFREALNEVQADGGGDIPEALDEGLADAMNIPTWRATDSTTQIIFIVADAPPQVERDVEQPYDNSLRSAAARGIKIFPIASSGSENDAEYVFRQMAQFTGSRFVFLSYGAGGSAALGSSTDISEADYNELPLNDLIVRLVMEELEPLNR